MVPQELLHANDMLNSVDGVAQASPALHGVAEDWLAYPKLVRGVVNVCCVASVKGF